MAISFSNFVLIESDFDHFFLSYQSLLLIHVFQSTFSFAVSIREEDFIVWIYPRTGHNIVNSSVDDLRIIEAMLDMPLRFIRAH
ncbi:hypothetical protein [Brevibacillus laterosporus]|uniref:hypothetical protein n=1 Tax=Brevibacillus laterosporus TaxID=1465 RepID=UPI0003B1CE84|nr:hypothetical protein [Brevibacillus laterosporus]ERM17933.1 hypothetical protein P615_02230 [Brevibacillus laterosporus PE36]